MSERKERCVALDHDGKRCRRTAVVVNRYHGDSEIYGYDGPQPTWVRVAFCDRHNDQDIVRRTVRR